MSYLIFPFSDVQWFFHSGGAWFSGSPLTPLIYPRVRRCQKRRRSKVPVSAERVLFSGSRIWCVVRLHVLGVVNRWCAACLGTQWGSTSQGRRSSLRWWSHTPSDVMSCCSGSSRSEFFSTEAFCLSGYRSEAVVLMKLKQLTKFTIRCRCFCLCAELKLLEIKASALLRFAIWIKYLSLIAFVLLWVSWVTITAKVEFR